MRNEEVMEKLNEICPYTYFETMFLPNELQMDGYFTLDQLKKIVEVLEKYHNEIH
jgi:DNA-directed RNA polymerase subunit F